MLEAEDPGRELGVQRSKQGQEQGSGAGNVILDNGVGIRSWNAVRGNRMGQLSDEWNSIKYSAERAFSRDGYSHSEELWLKALPLAEQFEEGDDRLITTIVGITRAMLMQKKHWEAIPYLHWTIDLYRNRGNIYNDMVARCSVKLAKIYCEFEMYTESEEMFKLTLDVHTKTYGPAEQFTVEVLADYAELLHTLHRDDEAEHMMYCARAYLGGEWKPIGDRPQSDI